MPSTRRERTREGTNLSMLNGPTDKSSQNEALLSPTMNSRKNNVPFSTAFTFARVRNTNCVDDERGYPKGRTSHEGQ